MAAEAKKKKAPAVPPLFKRWVTEDEALIVRLDVEKPGHELVLTVEDATADEDESDGCIELAADIPQIDELIEIFTKAKEITQRYNRGEPVECDIEEEEEEEEEEEIEFIGGEDGGEDDEDEDEDDDEDEDEEDDK